MNDLISCIRFLKRHFNTGMATGDGAHPEQVFMDFCEGDIYPLAAVSFFCFDIVQFHMDFFALFKALTG